MKRLDHKLDCKKCGTIYLDLPEDVGDDTLIHCSSCNQTLGTWSELQRDFYRQAGQGVFHLHDGQIDALTTGDILQPQVLPDLIEEVARPGSERITEKNEDAAKALGCKGSKGASLKSD